MISPVMAAKASTFPIGSHLLFVTTGNDNYRLSPLEDIENGHSNFHRERTLRLLMEIIGFVLPLSRGTQRQTLHSCFVIMTMCATVISVMKNLSRFLISFDCDDLDTYWHRLLTLLAANQFREIDFFDDAGIFSPYFSN
jgi:hypothetical protein